MEKFEVITTVPQDIEFFGERPLEVKENVLERFAHAQTMILLLQKPISWISSQAYTLFSLAERFGLCIPSHLQITSSKDLPCTTLFDMSYMVYSPQHKAAKNFLQKLEKIDSTAIARCMRETGFHPYPLPPQWSAYNADTETLIEVFV
jgi:hypothetical protein